ncbi:chalcone isomerase family protein [Gluconacetobacter sacchari]|uniref:Chalcone isomerase domain-containing protein n=2 Tax=Gluconacetobacter sacchari TaxID=92759 RepID=A0A7W4NNF9_9PROT|nr:chalcone isomerase family protein [Gluconacetobacter sacchari]MBB2160992.1 hypothetical protein [Gluconacetobacter sacchari]GBQ24521.1 hypothetical protein AA12717_1811 [Gluconacetobacter sacchari DSM 12717]
MPGLRWLSFRIPLALAAGLVVASSAGHADTRIGGAVFPDDLKIGNTSLKLNGVGVRVFYHLVDGYATGLYVVSPGHDGTAIADGPNPKVIYTEFLRDASLERVKDEYDSIHARYCKIYGCSEKNEASYAAFTGHLAAARKGEAQLVLVTDQGVSMQRNGVVVASIDDPAFGKGMVQSLLSAAAPTKGFRDGLLGIAN